MTDQPQIPDTAAAAGEKLATLQADKTWTDRLLVGDANVKQEWHRLHERAARGDEESKTAETLAERVTAAMTGNIQNMPDSEAELMHGTATMLRELGIRDEVIQQTLSGQEVSQAEFDAVKHWQTRALQDAALLAQTFDRPAFDVGERRQDSFALIGVSIDEMTVEPHSQTFLVSPLMELDRTIAARVIF